ncbi:MAG: ANTAR domain-containing protein [Acidimicrobiales bacterium]
MISHAQGTLKERELLTGDGALDIRRRASQRLNRKLREVAQDMVDTGEGPDTGVDRRREPSDPRGV